MANLTQLGMLEKLNGFLPVDKPAGIAFSSVVKVVKRKFNLVKVGHGGSLDAMASGLLMLLIGDANKFVDGVMGADRAYEGTMRLGTATNTHDVHGEVTGKMENPVWDETKLASSLKEFKGDIFQTEPQFCSVRREGSALYEIADTGEHSQFLAHVYRFDVEHPAAENPTSANFRLVASKGVIVRTLVNDFGEMLGCGAALESLRRTRIGKFDVTEAIPFDRLLESEMRDFSSLVIPLSRALA